MINYYSNQPEQDIELVEEGKQALYCLFADNPGGVDAHTANSIVSEYELSPDDLHEVAELLDMPGYEPEDRVRVNTR